jgi:hypothetical protein
MWQFVLGMKRRAWRDGERWGDGEMHAYERQDYLKDDSLTCLTIWYLPRYTMRLLGSANVCGLCMHGMEENAMSRY